MSRLTSKENSYIGRYTSTSNFVNQHGLHKEAVNILGKTWEEDGDDVSQIDMILEHIRPNGFRVKFLNDCKYEDDIEVRETDSFTNDPVYIWFNDFVDFIGNIDSNIYNNACKYADSMEKERGQFN